MKKIFIGIIIGIMSVTFVYATETIIESINVSYDNKTSGGSFTNVQESIDELYERAGLLKEKWVEKDLNGADPVLEVTDSTKKLIPVTIDKNGKVKYANLYTEWYNYAKKKWANAVILVDKKKDAYKTGDIINENDIESYFVWIPRYSYKIWNMGNYDSAPNITTLTDENYATSPQNAFNKARIIDIKFGDTKTNPKMSESQAQLDNYYTHPAFTLGDKDLNGIWVGKFETGYNQDGDNGEPFTIDDKWTKVGAGQNTEASNRIIVKPNVYSWRNNIVKNFFMSSFNYDRTLESHMMKNTEWGAVAYLSHSVYGLGGEISINNNSDCVTGYGDVGTKQETRPGTYGGAAPTQSTDITQPYNTGAGNLASTTGNITGVYDMSGGAWEYMAAYMSGQLGSSGFLDESELTTTYKNYVDIYSADSTVTSYNKRILGDATGEMGPFYRYFDGDKIDGSAGSLRYHNSWYIDFAHFVYISYPWFHRGGIFLEGSLAGQFYFTGGTGGADAFSSRLVLSPNNVGGN